MTDRHQRALALFRDLLRIDTTNPPGNEAPAAERLAEFFRAAGLDARVLESRPGRANVITRLKGDGSKAPLLLGAHLDVVPADDGPWSRPPFAAEELNGWIYGRGAIDMKNMAAMSACVLVGLHEDGLRLERDLIFAGVADEEAGCDVGSTWLVDQHPDLVRAEFALGEVGGFTMHVLGRRVYPIQVAEKGVAWIRATARGEAGHGSIPREDSAVVRLGEAIAAIGRQRLPPHPVETVEAFVNGLAESLPPPARWILPWVLAPATGELLLDNVLPDPSMARSLAASLSNTASPTVLRGGSKTNVIPSEASVELDGRTLPGQSSADLLQELREVCGPEIEFEVLRDMPPVQTSADTPVFRELAAALQRHDPEAIPLPYMIPGFTDAKAWHRLGTRCYGFSPVRIPADAKVAFSDLYHRPNERIPIDGFCWGLDVLDDAVRRICAAPS